MNFVKMLLGNPGTGGQRAEQALAGSKFERQFIMDQLARQTGRIKKTTGQQMALSMGGQSAAANAAREAQQKAMERVGAFSGGNPLAMASAMSQLGGAGALGSIFSQGASQRSGILGGMLSAMGQAEGLAATGRQNVLAGEQSVLGSIQDAEPGMLGGLLEAYMGMQGMKGMGGGGWKGPPWQ